MNKVFFRAEGIPMPLWIKAANSFILLAMENLGLKNWDLSVLFCSNGFIKTLNGRYRNKEEPTDVLSFPIGDKGPGGRFVAGDIVISLEALEENARFFRVSEDEELRRLLVHGILHLSGNDHATNGEEEPMLKAQEETLAALAFERIQETAQ